MAMHCPRSSPSFASPAVSASTRSRTSLHVQHTSSPLVRTNTSSGRLAAVMRNASANVAASIALRVAVPDSIDCPSPGGLLPGTVLPHAESLSGQAPDVVGEAHGEDEQQDRKSVV